MVNKDYQYIEMELIEEKDKTNVYQIVAKSTSVPLGEIKWSGQWRQYCFYPDGLSQWSVGCLKDVIDFINQLMYERRKGNGN